METINILIVDDHKIIINGIKSLLEDATDICILSEAADGLEAIQSIKNVSDIQLVLMDIRMPNMDGVQATREITAQFPHIKVVALTMFDDNQYITSMLQAGARGYILKNTGKQELIRAIRLVAEGGTYFSSDVTSVVMSTYMNKSTPTAVSRGTELDPSQLTGREIEILKLIAFELTNKEIADKLIISPRTVHSHRRNLMQKIGVKNTAGLVRYALQFGILDEKEVIAK